MENRREDLPGGGVSKCVISQSPDAHLPRNIQLVVSDKVGVVAPEGIQNKGLVRFRDLCLFESALVRKVELDRDGPCQQSRRLGVHLHVDGLVRLDTEDELVSRNVGEDAGGDVLVLNSDLDLGFIES